MSIASRAYQETEQNQSDVMVENSTQITLITYLINMDSNQFLQCLKISDVWRRTLIIIRVGMTDY